MLTLWTLAKAPSPKILSIVKFSMPMVVVGARKMEWVKCCRQINRRGNIEEKGRKQNETKA